MRKYSLYALMVALMTVSAFALVSCSDDDDVKLSEASIVGSWSVDGGNAWGIDASMSGSIYGDSYWMKEYMRFYEDGSCVDIQESQMFDDYDLDISYGTWTLDGSSLNLRINGATYTYEVKDITKDKITASMWGITAYLVRVSDSVIEEYLINR